MSTVEELKQYEPQVLAEMVLQLEEQVQELLHPSKQDLDAIHDAIESMRGPTHEVLQAVQEIRMPPIAMLQRAEPQLVLLKELNVKLDLFNSTMRLIAQLLNKQK